MNPEIGSVFHWFLFIHLFCYFDLSCSLIRKMSYFGDHGTGVVGTNCYLSASNC